MQVCSQWRRVAHDERLWYRLYTRADFLVSPASRAGESWKLVRHAWRQAAASHAPGLTCTGSRSQHPSLVITALSKLAPVAAPALHEDGRFGWCVVRRCAWRRDVPFQRSEVGALQLCGRSSLQGGSLVPHRHLQAPNLHVSPAPPSCAPFTALGTPQPLSAATVTCMHGDESTFITGGDDGSMQVPCPAAASAPGLARRRHYSRIGAGTGPIGWVRASFRVVGSAVGVEPRCWS